MKNILLLGSGGHASTVIDIIDRDLDFNIIGLVSNNLYSEVLCGYKIIGQDKDLAKLRKICGNAFLAFGHFGDSKTRVNLQNILESLKYSFPNVVSNHSVVSSFSSVGIGNYIGNGVCINANSKIGNHCIINTNALVEHDCIIGDHTHISTGALINGGVSIGSGSFIGSGSIIREGVSLPSNTIISAGKRIMGWPLNEN